jgi:acetyl-CoA carboxylase biotin carboxyl carrier protein
MTVSYDEISEILKVIDESSCDEFILETSDIKLVVRRGNAANPTMAEPASSPAILKTPAASPSSVSSVTASKPNTAAHAILAPMVGTFYRSPSPGAPPFVEINSKVRKGDAICIIEVMKLFTTIHAEWDGTVTEIGAENGTLVEYGQMLFVVTSG